MCKRRFSVRSSRLFSLERLSAGVWYLCVCAVCFACFRSGKAAFEMSERWLGCKSFSVQIHQQSTQPFMFALIFGDMCYFDSLFLGPYYSVVVVAAAAVTCSRSLPVRYLCTPINSRTASFSIFIYEYILASGICTERRKKPTKMVFTAYFLIICMHPIWNTKFASDVLFCCCFRFSSQWPFAALNALFLSWHIIIVITIIIFGFVFSSTWRCFFFFLLIN